METLKSLTLLVSTVIKGAGAIIVALAAVEAFFRALPPFISRRRALAELDAKEVVRLRFGRWLAVSLDLELGADILRTAVAPTWTEIGQPAAIAALRTAPNFFLQPEIDKAQSRQHADDTKTPVAPGQAGDPE